MLCHECNFAFWQGQIFSASIFSFHITSRVLCLNGYILRSESRGRSLRVEVDVEAWISPPPRPQEVTEAEVGEEAGDKMTDVWCVGAHVISKIPSLLHLSISRSFVSVWLTFKKSWFHIPKTTKQSLLRQIIILWERGWYQIYGPAQTQKMIQIIASFPPMNLPDSQS
jgi:hypothetical protein